MSNKTALDAFCNKHAIYAQVKGVTATAKEVANWPSGSTHFQVTLRRGRKCITTRFHQGPALKSEPTAADVLNCLVADATSVLNARGFDDWCEEYGYDPDAPGSEKLYRELERQCERLKSFLPDDVDLWDVAGLEH